MRVVFSKVTMAYCTEIFKTQRFIKFYYSIILHNYIIHFREQNQQVNTNTCNTVAWCPSK